MDIKQRYLLANHTSFRIGGQADFFVSVASLDDLKEAVRFAQEKNLQVLILGSGSNILVSDDGFRGLVIGIDIKGLKYDEISQDEVLLNIGAGEVWDEVVASAVLRELWGIENLSNIPGLSGALPVQNVGAYGQEASAVIQELSVFNLESGETEILKNSECGFSYRTSNFNTIWKNKYVILSVTLKLSRIPKPNLIYLDVKKYFEAALITNPSITQIRHAITEIRKNKFPDLTKLGCAGSFFKNVILTPQKYMDLAEKIKANFSSEVFTKLEDLKTRFLQEGSIKIPAAFLVDICNLKGQTIGDARLWDKQPIVIINMGNAKAKDVVDLFNLVKKIVAERTGVQLGSEPEFIGFK